ncbi:MAG: Cytolethal distending toxin subunit B [Luteibacter sp.]|uniref:endonuclease/exonuclease/phosphatase family protein n=1 Tax=Luteibacter sp. TaxID=1886636 RepID=UPI0013845445|nr:endonuclease/exonuclease/phosphatase family protein [Luteibacter sp.]KAF1004821.1 MAG: Cytolethal distending toxin subunit B [Luteibacter sp.]
MNVVTWNAQGAQSKWGAISQEMKSGAFSMLLLQEVTEVTKNATFVADYGDCHLYRYSPGGTRFRPLPEWYIVYHEWRETWPGGNKRCSLATAIRQYRPTHAETRLLPGNRRPTLGVQPGAGRPWIFNLHATSGGGGAADAKDLIAGIWGDETVYSAQAGWVLAGDFNADPGQMEAHPFYENHIVHPPTDPTHPAWGRGPYNAIERSLDYAISSPDVGVSEQCERYESALLQSDHYPQLFEVNAAIPVAGAEF